MFEIVILITVLTLIILAVMEQIRVKRLRESMSAIEFRFTAWSRTQKTLGDDVVRVGRRLSAHRELVKANMKELQDRLDNTDPDIPLRQWALAQAIERGFTPGSTLEEAEKYYNWITRTKVEK